MPVKTSKQRWLPASPSILQSLHTPGPSWLFLPASFSPSWLAYPTLYPKLSYILLPFCLPDLFVPSGLLTAKPRRPVSSLPSPQGSGSDPRWTLPDVSGSVLSRFYNKPSPPPCLGHVIRFPSISYFHSSHACSSDRRPAEATL